MSDKTIRFIDSEYRELFRIPDGGSIKVIYPSGDGRGTLVRPCEYMGETHVKIDGNVYHICEFAERMEALGARYEPEAPLVNAGISPVGIGDEKYCIYNREEGNTCVGHIGGDFGNGGDRFRFQQIDRENGRNTPEFQSELLSVIYALRQNVLKDYSSMLEYCQSHPHAKLPNTGEYNVYGFKLATDTRDYFIRCFAEREARFNVYAYDKEAPTREKTRHYEDRLDPQRPPKAPKKRRGGVEL